MFVRRRSDNKVKVETFPIKRARVRKEICLWSGHVPINLTLSIDFMLKIAIKLSIRAGRKLRRRVRVSREREGSSYNNPNRIILR